MSVSEELARFVRTSLERGVERGRVEAVLLEAGWRRERVEEALGAFAESEFPVPVPRPRPYLSPREAFLYLLLFTTLYLSAFNLGGLLFELIEVAVPDPADPVRHGLQVSWNVANLVVAFPVYVLLARRQERELRDEPAARGSKVRKWLTYGTLFVAAGFLIGDLVALVYGFLEGDLTLRFFLKVLVVAAIAGTVFTYYLRDLRGDET